MYVCMYDACPPVSSSRPNQTKMKRTEQNNPNQLGDICGWVWYGLAWGLVVGVRRYTYLLCISCHPLHVHRTSHVTVPLHSFYLPFHICCRLPARRLPVVELVFISFVSRHRHNSPAFLASKGGGGSFSVSVSIFFLSLSTLPIARLTFNGLCCIYMKSTLKSATIKLIQNASNGQSKKKKTLAVALLESHHKFGF